MLLRKSALSAHWYNIERGRGEGEIEEGRFSAKKCRCPNTFVQDCLSWTTKTKMSITSQWFIVLPPNLNWWVFVTLFIYWVCNGLIGIVLARDVCDYDVSASICKSMERPSQLAQNIRSESFQQFQARVLLAMENVPVEVVDRTIMSMPKRIQAILDSKGTEQNITTAWRSTQQWELWNVIADLIDRNKYRFLCCILIDSFNNSTIITSSPVAWPHSSHTQFTPTNSRINRRLIHFWGKRSPGLLGLHWKHQSVAVAWLVNQSKYDFSQFSLRLLKYECG